MLPVCYPELDAIFTQSISRGARSICITAANPDEGVSTVALDFVTRGAAAGLSTVLVDANLARPTISASLGLARARWSPVEGVIGRAAVMHRAGFSVLPPPIHADAMVFRDPLKLRQLLDTELHCYDLIVVDTSSVNLRTVDLIPAEAIAPACATTVIVVLAGVTSQSAVRVAVDRLNVAGAGIWGVVLNDRVNPPLADDLLRVTSRLAWVAPRASARIGGWIRGSRILNLAV